MTLPRQSLSRLWKGGGFLPEGFSRVSHTGRVKKSVRHICTWFLRHSQFSVVQTWMPLYHERDGVWPHQRKRSGLYCLPTSPKTSVIMTRQSSSWLCWLPFIPLSILACFWISCWPPMDPSRLLLLFYQILTQETQRKSLSLVVWPTNLLFPTMLRKSHRAVTPYL